jgi:hypothetical protein
MKINQKMPLYIAVKLNSGNKSVWLPLPANKARFNAALEKIDASYGKVNVAEYACHIPGMWWHRRLMEVPLAVVNYLASRLNKLSDYEILKLCAICDTDFYFVTVEQYIDYTFQTYCYTLLPHVTDEESLGKYHIGSPKHRIADKVLKKYIDRLEYGRRLAEAENGAFTPNGYLTSSIGWYLPSKGRNIPDSLNLKDYNGGDLYGYRDEDENPPC